MITIEEYRDAILSKQRQAPELSAADVTRVLAKNLGGVFLDIEIDDADDAAVLAERMFEASSKLPQLPDATPEVVALTDVEQQILAVLSGGEELVELRDLVRRIASDAGKPAAPRLVAEVKRSLASLVRTGRVIANTSNQYRLPEES